MKRDSGARWFAAAGMLLAVSLLLPWWEITMHAPQYPEGLHVTTWFFTVTGDVHEVDGLNHYIGFMPLAKVAMLERQAAFVVGPLFTILLLLAVPLRTRWSALLALPAATLPAVFFVDLAVWLQYAGHHLDPHAALSSSVAPWTPNIFGSGGVGQFHTDSAFGIGFYLASLASIAAIMAIANRVKNMDAA